MGSLRRPALVAAILCACVLLVIWLAGVDLRGLSVRGTIDDPAAWMWGLSGAAGGALVGAGFCLAWLANRSVVRRLASSLEQPSTEIARRPLAEVGPPAVARLIRVINARAARDAEQLAEHLNLQAEFAHDMRGPIARIALRCERLTDADLRRRMERDLAELNSLVESSLVFARTLHGARQPMQRIDVDSLLESLMGDYEDAGCTIEVVGRIGQPVRTCPRSLRRVLTNLIDNALRHGGGARLSARAEAQQVVLAVLDDGPGVEPAQLKEIFSPWYRATSSREHPSGSGLGLAIARRLALSIKGELRARNRIEGGFEAALTLPIGNG
jgi:signal transduction histidine kinase